MSDMPDIAFRRIKAATRELFLECGGLKCCAAVVGVTDTMLSRWQSNTDKAMIPLISVLLLEAHCGRAVITEVMADLSNYTPPPSPAGTMIPNLLQGVANRGKRSAVIIDIISDQKITNSEIDVLQRHLAEEEAEIRQTQLNLSAMRAQVANDE